VDPAQPEVIVEKEVSQTGTESSRLWRKFQWLNGNKKTKTRPTLAQLSKY